MATARRASGFAKMLKGSRKTETPTIDPYAMPKPPPRKKREPAPPKKKVLRRRRGRYL